MIKTKKETWIELESITGKRVIFRLPSEEKNWRNCLCIESIIMWKYANEYTTRPEHLPIWDCKSSLNLML
ncbi:hypothetical protein CN918_30250 [Priestia megaterium]|nr:hypothetical protein CN918_30250 [Priestia megaterium]